MKSKKFRKHFRKQDPTKETKYRHPAYIVGQEKKEYEYIGFTHSPKVDDVDTVPMINNPDSKDKRKSYAFPYVSKKSKDGFGRRLDDLKLSKKDKDTIEKIISKYEDEKKK